jgi:hypothetical protein
LQAFVAVLGVPPNLSGPSSFVQLTDKIKSASIREMRLVSLPMLPGGVQVPERTACLALHVDRED